MWIRNFVLIGSSQYPDVDTPGDSPTGGEGQLGFLMGTNRFEVSGCTISKVWGDGFYVTHGSSDVWIHDNHVISAGRNGMAVICGTDIIAERNTFDTCGYHTFDVEPSVAADVCTTIICRLNTAGTYGQSGQYFFNIYNPNSSTIDGVIVDDNTVLGDSLSAYVYSEGSVRTKHVTFTNNEGELANVGPDFFFTYIDGLTATGNVQSLSSGVLMNITDCTGTW